MTDSPKRAKSEEPVPAIDKLSPAGAAIKTLTSDKLFEGQKEVVIEHAGERYRLRITRRNKLILQK